MNSKCNYCGGAGSLLPVSEAMAEPKDDEARKQEAAFTDAITGLETLLESWKIRPDLCFQIQPTFAAAIVQGVRKLQVRISRCDKNPAPEVEALVTALQAIIADADYRGIRSTESIAAFNALAEYRKAVEEK